MGTFPLMQLYITFNGPDLHSLTHSKTQKFGWQSAHWIKFAAIESLDYELQIFFNPTMGQKFILTVWWVLNQKYFIFQIKSSFPKGQINSLGFRKYEFLCCAVPSKNKLHHLRQTPFNRVFGLVWVAGKRVHNVELNKCSLCSKAAKARQNNSVGLF